jgi:hypothetical protein
LYGYLRLSSASVWPAAPAYGAINTFVVVFGSITVAIGSPDLLEYWAGESGVLNLIGITLLASWLLYRLNRQPSDRQTAAKPARQTSA